MTNVETITLEVSPDLKREAEKICATMGLTVSAACTSSLKNIVNTGVVPTVAYEAESHTRQKAMLSALRKASDALAGSAEKAGFSTEEELQRYAKDVIRAEVWEEYKIARNA